MLGTLAVLRQFLGTFLEMLELVPAHAEDVLHRARDRRVQLHVGERGRGGGACLERAQLLEHRGAGANDPEHRRGAFAGAEGRGDVDHAIGARDEAGTRCAGGQGGIGGELHVFLLGVKKASTLAAVTSARRAGFQRGLLSLSTMSARMPSMKSPCAKHPWTMSSSMRKQSARDILAPRRSCSSATTSIVGDFFASASSVFAAQSRNSGRFSASSEAMIAGTESRPKCRAIAGARASISLAAAAPTFTSARPQ